VGWGWFRKKALDRSRHIVEMLQHFVIPEAHNAKALLLEEPLPLFVMTDVLAVLLIIHLDDEATLDAREVGNVRSNRMLAAELATVNLPSAQLRPQLTLRHRHVSA
jgi:hypothetical protein